MENDHGIPPTNCPASLIALGEELLNFRQACRTNSPSLEGVPVLDNWEFVYAHWKGLAGNTYGCPKLGSGSIASTPIVAIDTDPECVTTFNTLYRLESNGRVRQLPELAHVEK